MADKVVPSELVLDFFRDATLALERMDYASAVEVSAAGPNLTLSDCRRCVLEIQKSKLSMTVREHNKQNGSSISVEAAQAYLAGLSQTTGGSSAENTHMAEAMKAMEEAARQAVCRLVLYTESHWVDESTRILQKRGTMERAKLLEFFALCQRAIKLPFVQEYLANGSPLFEDIEDGSDSSKEEEATAMRFPQARLERIQRLISRAVGWHPEFTTSELRRLVLMQPNASEYANDQEVLSRFQQVILQMNAAVTTASLQASRSQLSDIDQGGVTRVVSVQCSEVFPANNDSMPSPAATAPTKVTINPHFTEEEQKQQIRIASEATKLQQEIVGELLSMTEEQRNRQLEEARRASEEFLKETMALPPGRVRIEYMQSVDPHTSKLLAIHKLWPTVQKNHGVL